MINTTAKGNRADRECRNFLDIFGKTEKARVSRGAYDFTFEPETTNYCKMVYLRDYLRVCFGLSVRDALRISKREKSYWQVKSNSAGDARRKFRALKVRDGEIRVLAIRYDGRGRKPARWRFEIVQEKEKEQQR